MRRTGTLACAAALAVLVAAGCGSSGGGTTATDAWATGVCTAITTWQGQLKTITSSVTSDGVSKASIDKAITQAKDATNQLADSLKKLGKPDTQAGQQAKDDVQQLSDELSSGIKKVQDSVSGASGAAQVLAGVSVATGTLSTMVTQVSTTIGDLQKLDPKGELEQAFRKSDACKPLLGS